ncbi:uncharacterized protein A4U43_C09F10800 [Asparagus officinalis]|uniref:C2 domain-containing protein n=1 Tax=Asparagus officinalis TaxID=4686 RepID=A0A5P1E9W1_ASPOF|nr:protein C2-DOMAIN ABA-RELATED 8-like [Asparagus officinalis]ONK58305.1 uncharacterized protein A4U43_C09F10800 [Asparagus officinalis]
MTILTISTVDKRLVIRDFTSSDPYVVVKVENQTAKTKVINSCLNPVWNEELTFSIKDPLSELKLVYIIKVIPYKLRESFDLKVFSRNIDGTDKWAYANGTENQDVDLSNVQ